MADEVNLFKFCGSPSLEEKLWRNMFIAHIFGIDMPKNLEICRLPEDISMGISSKNFSDALASLLILYGGGYIDLDTFTELLRDYDNYTEEISEAERILVEQGNENAEDKYTARIIKNVLMCAVNSKKYDEIQQIDISAALALYDGSYTNIIDGFVYLKDKEFLDELSEHGIEFGNVSDNRIQKTDNVTLDSILLDIKDFAYLTTVYKQPYYKDFLEYVRSENIPFDDELLKAYEGFVHKCKMNFVVKVYPRKRRICTKFPNWFDYNVPGDKEIETIVEDLTKYVGKDVEYNEDRLVNLAMSKILRNRVFVSGTVLEVAHNNITYIFIIRDDKTYDRLDNEKFHQIPFDFDNIWTTICEWSRDKKLQKVSENGKFTVKVTPESEWEKIAPQDREYAKRIAEEQIQLREEQLNKNKLMQKLCELKLNAANEVKTKQEEAEKAAQQKAEEKAKKKQSIANRKGATD